jgi:AAA domain
MDKGATFDGNRPTTHQGDLAKLPAALAPLVARPQWAVWKYEQRADGSWQKPPHQARDPRFKASTTNPQTWASYTEALAAVQAERADGITYVLTEDDPFAAADLDDCRSTRTNAITKDWAASLLEQTQSYREITPSGEGYRIWGLASGPKLVKQVHIAGGGALEIYRHCHKALTVTGLEFAPAQSLENIDRVLERAAAWAEQHKAKPEPVNSIGFNSSGVLGAYSIEELDRIVAEGAAAGANRSDMFHAIVGHYLGCGETEEQIVAHFRQHPDGIANRYIAEGRLAGEVQRSIGKYQLLGRFLPTSGAWVGWQPPADELDEATHREELEEAVSAFAQQLAEEEQQTPPWDEEPAPGPEQPADAPAAEAKQPEAEPQPQDEPVDDELEDDEVDELDQPAVPQLPPLYAQWVPDQRPIRSWLIKRLLATTAHGLIAGQWGTYKTFVALDLAACVMTGQSFLGRAVKRQSGVLFIAAEGAEEVRLRVDAVVREKCGTQGAPFCWYEAAPTLLRPDAVETLVAMAKQAHATLQREFGLPLGLILIDTVAASAGYNQMGAENDSAVGQTIMNVLAQVAALMNCCVLGVDHFGKNVDSGTRGASAKEASAAVVLAVLGTRELSGRVTNTRVALRKVRGAPQGEEYWFMVRKVDAPEPDEDDEPVSTLVIDWQQGPPAAGQAQPETDPWQASRNADMRQNLALLERILMAGLAKKGTPIQVAPDEPMRQAINLELLRSEFYAQLTEDGTPEEKQGSRQRKFHRARCRAQELGLIGIREIDAVTYVWLESLAPKDTDENF